MEVYSAGIHTGTKGSVSVKRGREARREGPRLVGGVGRGSAGAVGADAGAFAAPRRGRVGERRLPRRSRAAPARCALVGHGCGALCGFCSEGGGGFGRGTRGGDGDARTSNGLSPALRTALAAAANDAIVAAAASVVAAAAGKGAAASLNRARRRDCGSAGGGASRLPPLSSSSAANALGPRAVTSGAAARTGATVDEKGRKAPKRKRCGEGAAPESRRGEEPARCGDPEARGDPARAAADAAEGEDARSPPLHEAAADDADARAADNAAPSARENELERLGDPGVRLGDADAPRTLLLVGLKGLLALWLLLLLLLLLTVPRACEGVGDADALRPRRKEAAARGDLIAAARARGEDGVGITRSVTRASVLGGSAL